MEDYMEAVGVFSLSLIAVSAAFLVKPSNPVTFLALVPLTTVLGFVIYISESGFEKDSLAALPTLILGVAGMQVAAAAVFISVAAPLTSVFSGGRRFRDYFTAASVPVLAAGLALGLAAAGALQFNTGMQQQAANATADAVGGQFQLVVEESGFVERFSNAQVTMVETASEASVAMTAAYVENASLDRQDQAEVAEQLQAAQDEVPQKISARVTEETPASEEVTGQVEASLHDLLEGRMAVLAIPIVAGTAYALRPVVALFSAIFAYLFSRILG